MVRTKASTKPRVPPKTKRKVILWLSVNELRPDKTIIQEIEGTVNCSRAIVVTETTSPGSIFETRP